ncbi:P-loop containing nucleoside triphosphate hydrolase [Phytophthora cactorum]|nr:P-loop containing nucleoside triphosphate hydrolase [Phytophthora cactorum]
MEGSSLTTTSASGAAAFTVESIAEGQENSTRDTKKFVKKGKHSEKKATAASVALHGSIDADQRQSGCVAAAWGEEVGSVSTVSAHLSKYAQALMVQRGHSFKLAFDDLTCAGKVNESSKESSDVVRGVTGYAESRTMTAVIGADRAGYSWFGDAHAVWHGTTTVREALSLSACLRQDASILRVASTRRSRPALSLGLVELADHHIESCSAVETRLVAIGVELAFAPTVLLLDEPTSGLDEKSAQRILRVLQQVARTGRTVVCSLGDSASSAALRTFDRLLMLSSSGETLFHGETRLVVQYLEALPGVKKMSSGKRDSVCPVVPAQRDQAHIADPNAARGLRQTRPERSDTSINRSIQDWKPDSLRGFVAHASDVARSTSNVLVLAQPGFNHDDSLGGSSDYAVGTRWSNRIVPGVVPTVLVGLFVARSTEYDTFDGVNQVASLIAWSTLMLGASLAFGAIVRASRGNENACWQREQAWQAYPAMALTWLLVPQRFALQALQALVFGTAHSCVYDGEAEGARAESELQCRELRLIPSDQHFYNNQQQVTVHSYAELEYGAERGFVVFRLVELGIFLVVFRILVIVALRKR